jgi:hypothetical protein
MKVNEIRTFALAAAATALLLAVAAGARQQGDTKSAKTPETAPAEAAPASAADKTAPVEATPAAQKHDHGAMEKIPSGSQQAKGKYMTIVGEIMDPACFLEAGAKSIGPGHYQCAINCARSGQTLAIYCRDEDRIYFIAGELPGKNPNDPVMAYIHKKVDVSGTVYHRSDAYGIVITKVVLHEEKPSDKKDTEKSSKPGIDKAGATEKAEVDVDEAGTGAAGAPAGK